ncbi:thioesterase II family protein [Kitasatospora camelliae]|uniref:Thioesterase domain-containing protein n=1 Tax=Kitasatospora camelliae TaxID=3156397 RepID=A0AAU8K8P9_9ACTN
MPHLRTGPRADRRLVCFPHAGGSASYFRPVATALSPRVEVIAVQYPGRQDRRLEPPVDDIGLLADRIADALAPCAEPLHLQRAGRTPVQVFSGGHFYLSDRPAEVIDLLRRRLLGADPR